LAPLKRVEIIEGNLYLTYFEANDRLKTNALMGKRDWALNSSLIIEGICTSIESMFIFHQNGKTELNFQHNQLTITDGIHQRFISTPFIFIEAPLVRVLLRESVFEIYYNRFYMTSFSMYGAFSGKMDVPPTFTIWESINM